MLAEIFERSLTADRPPIYYTDALRALWYAAKGDAQTAMDLAQAASSLNAAWVRAHLHRTNREPGHAGQWYRTAHREPPEMSIERERTSIALTLLSELTIR